MSIILKSLTVEQAQNHRSPELYVVNNFVDRNNRFADVMGAYRDVNSPYSNEQTYKIPVSWVPQRITSFAMKESFLEGSRDFLRAVDKKWLIIVDPKQAQELFENNQSAQLELDRLQLQSQGQSIGADTLVEGGIDLEALRTRNVKPVEENNKNYVEITNPPQVQVQHETSGVSPQLVDIIHRTDMGEQQRLNAIKSLPLLNDKEREYLHKNTRDANILTWLKQDDRA